MTDIKELLSDVAEQAKVYDVSKPVVQVARRRARTRWLAPIAAAAAVVLAATVGWTVWPDRPADLADPATEPGVVDNLDWLPPQARPPAEPPPVLPADRAVGPAALVYASCAAGGCHAYLLLADGNQYRLTERRQKKEDVVGGISLSPDGRWLGQQRADGYVLRDLTAVTARRLSAKAHQLSWSPNSRWLAYRTTVATAPSVYPMTLVDMRTFRTFDFGLETSFRAAALLDTGELLYSDLLPDEGLVGAHAMRTKVQFRAVNPTTGRTRVALDVDLADELRDLEEVRPSRVLVSQDGGSVFLRATRWSASVDFGSSDDILQVTWRGTVTRYELPDPTPADAAGSEPPDELWAKSGESWGLAGQYGKDLLLRHYDNADADLQALDTRTGELRTVCRLPKGITEMFVQRGW